MQGLQGGEDAMLRLDQLEALYYKLQLQLYDIQAEVLRCEELLVTAQLQSLRRQMTGEQLLYMIKHKAQGYSIILKWSLLSIFGVFLWFNIVMSVVLNQNDRMKWSTTMPLRAPMPWRASKTLQRRHPPSEMKISVSYSRGRGSSRPAEVASLPRKSTSKTRRYWHLLGSVLSSSENHEIYTHCFPRTGNLRCQSQPEDAAAGREPCRQQLSTDTATGETQTFQLSFYQSASMLSLIRVSRTVFWYLNANLLFSVKAGEADEDNEAKQNARVSQERQRTLDRLRSLKQVRQPLTGPTDPFTERLLRHCWLTCEFPRSVIRVRWLWSPTGCVWVRLGGELDSSRTPRRPAFRQTTSQTSQNSLLLLCPIPAAATPCPYQPLSCQVSTPRLPSSPCLLHLFCHWFLNRRLLHLHRLPRLPCHLPQRTKSRVREGRGSPPTPQCATIKKSQNLHCCHFPLDSLTAASCRRRGRSWGRRHRWTRHTGGEVRTLRCYKDST